MPELFVASCSVLAGFMLTSLMGLGMRLSVECPFAELYMSGSQILGAIAKVLF